MFKSPPSRLKKITRRSAPWALLCCSLIVLTLLARTELTPPSSQGLGAQVAGADASLPGGIGSWFGRTVAQVDGVWQFSAQVIQSVLSVDSVPSIASPSTATSTPASSNERTSATRPTFTDRASSLQINVPLLLEQGLTVRGLSTTLGTTTIEAPLTVLGVSRMSSVVATGNVDAGSLTSTNVTVSGAAALAQATVSGSLGVQGMLEATGGVVTRGATIDLGTGELFASNVVNRVRGGSNVRITGPANAPTVSFIAEEFSGVESINGESGDVDFSGGEGIAVNGTVISSVDTLALVRARGGCVDCVTDTDVSNVLTLSGGSIDGVVIGSTTRAGSFFSSIVVGSSTFNSNALAVEGSAVINDVVSVLGTATSTFGGTVNLTGGCFSINGVCVGGTDITYTGLLDTPNTLIAASIPFVNATGSVLTQSADFTYDGTRLSVGTSTTATTLVVGGSATIGNVLNVSGAATSTFGGTVNLTSGCFSINGVCVTNAGTVTSVGLAAPTGFTASGPVTNSGTLTLSYAAGYEGFLTASGTNWNAFYNTPSTRITAGSGLSWSGNTLNAAAGTIYLATTTTWTTGFLARVASNGTVDSVATSSLGLSAAFANSAQLAALLSDETGTGSAVFGTGAVLSSTTLSGTSFFNGNVGIGVPNSLYPLDIGTADGNGDSLNMVGNLRLSSLISQIYNRSAASGSNLSITGGASSQSSLNLITTSAVGGSDYMTFSSGNAERMRLITNGNFGIGTTSPAARLTVDGDMRLTGRFADSSSSTGALGSILTSTANGTAWLATSSLGIGGSNWIDRGTFLTPLTASDGLVLTGSSTAMALRVSALRDSGNSLGTVGQILQTNGATSQWISTSTLNIALINTTGTLAANRGGTGVSALGGINTILYTSAVNTLATSTLFVFTGTNLGVGTSTPDARVAITAGAVSTSSALLVTSAANQRLFNVRADGWIGIGDAEPYAPLSIYGNGNGFGQLATFDSPQDAFLKLGAQGAGSRAGLWIRADEEFNNWYMHTLGLAGESKNLLVFRPTNNINDGTISTLTLEGFSGNVGIGVSSSTIPARLSVMGAGTSNGLLAQFMDSLGMAKLTMLDNGNLGLGTTTPGSTLTVQGGMRLTGRFADSSSSTGAVGSVLTATATGTAWVATSTLGLGGGGGSNWVDNGVFLNPLTATDGIVLTGSSTAMALRISALRDSSNSLGTVGQILQTNGATSQWVSTSTFGIALSDTTGTLAANRGGTGVSALGGIGTILYTSAVNTLASSSNFVFTGTNLGVGTSTPGSTLHIANGTTTQIRVSENTGQFFFDLGRNASDGMFQINGSQGSGYKWLNAGSEVMRISSGGNVGIGVSNPVAGLHLAKADMVVGTGEGGAPSLFTLRGVNASGTDVVGGDIRFDASRGTGIGGSGNLVFRTGNAVAAQVNVQNTTTIKNGNTNQLTTSHAVSAAVDNTLLVVQVAFASNGSTVSSITYNGTPLTLATSVGNGSNANRVEVWYLVNPTTGSNTLTANFSSFRATQMTAITLSNVNQASPIYAVATATNGGTVQSANVSSTPSTLVLDVVSTETGGPTVDPAQTLLWNDVQSVFAAGSYRQGVTTNTIMNWTTAGNYNWVQAAIAINLVGSGGVTQTPLAEAMRLNSMGNLGLGTSSPTNRLSVVGNGFFTGNLTGANISAIGTLNVTGLSTLTSLLATNATATRLTVAGDFSLNGRFADSSSSTGAVGSVLTSTTNGTAWAATSSLGFSAAFANSAQLAALLSDETGTGTVVFNTNPTFAGLTATGVSNFATLNATTTNASTTNVVTLNASGLSTLTRVTATAATTTALTITGALRDSTNATGTVGQILQSTGTSTQWITSSAANSFVQGGNAFGTTAIFGTNDNQSLLFRTNGVTGMTLDSQGRLGIGTTGPLALLSVNATSTSSVTKQTTADFSVSGASVSAGIATTSNEIKLLFATTTNLGAGVMSTGPTLGSSSLGDGAHSIQRPDGTFLIVRGFNTVDTLIYNPVTNSTSAGPNLTTLAYQSAHSIQRPDGKFLIVLGNGAPTRTNIYDPVANTIIEGPALTNGISGMGAHSIQRPNGTYLIVAGGSTATNIYDPVANTVSGGPTLTSAATLGSHSIQRPDGTFLVLIGNGTVTNIYDPVANSIAAGPTLPNILGGGGHSIQRPDGRFLVVLGFLGTNTAIYDPINNTFSTGPSLTATVSPFAHSIQRPDGRFLVVLSGGTATNIYDPIANTMTAGPTLTASAGLGAHTLQRPDGRYLMVLGNSTASTLYDAGWVMSGSYESEDLNISQLNQSSLLNFNGNGEGKIEVAIKTATTQGGLTSAPYATTTSNRFPIRPVNGAQWAKVRVTLSRSVAPHAQPRQPFTPTNTWLGESDTKYRRDFAQPALYNFTIDNQSVFRKENADFATGFATSTALSFASSSVPLLASLIGGDNGLSLPYRIGLVSSSTQSDDRGVFSGGPTLANTSSLGAHSIQRPDGKFLIVVAANSNATNIYDPDTNTITAGPTIASGNPSNGSHSIQRPDGKFLIVVGNNGGLTNIYDPVANTIVAGPAIGRSANVGSHSIQRPDGKFLIVLGNNGTQTTIYDPVANTMSPGPNIAGSGVNLGAHSIQRPDGTFLIVSGLNTDTSIYDPVINTMYTGPALVGTAAGSIGTGGHSIQRPDGKFLVVFGAGGTNTSIYDPVTNTSVAGPALPAVAGNGSHSIQRPDGKFLLVLGGSSNTAIYDPVANTMSTGPGVGNTPGQGAHSIQRPDGRYMMVLGGGFTTAIYDAGWLTTGTYLSEHINNSQLNSQSAFAWTGNADTFRPGVISISVRTAASEIGLGTSTWRTIKKSGDLINPASGDAWMQVRVVMRRPIAQQPNAGKNVYMGESTVVYNRLPLQAEGGTTSVNPANVFIRPTITSYKVFQVNSTDLAAFSLNGQNLFRFSAAGDAYTQTGGSWNSGGADIAEYFPTDDDTLEAGDIVTVAQSSAGLIAKSTDAYDDNALGIITTTPGIKLGIDITGGTAEKQPVALVGRVPTKVSLENGMIKKGDYITSSGRSGVGMKATDAGRVVGIALEDLDTTTLDDSGVGKVLVYVNPHTFLGVSFLEKITSKLSRWAYVVQEALGELGVTVTDDGNVGIGTTTPAARLSVTQSSNDYFGGFIISESGNTDFRSLSMATSGVLSFFGGDSSGTLNVATLNVAGEWTTPADVEHNEDVQTLTYGLDTLMQLQPRSYKMKNIEDMRVGFIAQELELIIPEVVDGVEGSKSISYGNLVAVVVKAVQELADRVTGFAEFFKTKKVETDELCIEDVCINKGQLQEILDKSDPTPEPSLSPEPLPLVPHTTSTSTSTPELPEEVSEEVIAEEEEVNVVEEVEEPVIEPIDDSVPAEPVPAEVVVTEPDTDAPLPE